MKEKIWYEMVHTKYGEIYLAFYLGRLKTKRKWFKILILLFSTAGIFGWKIWEGFPIAACILVSVMQLISLIENHIIPSDEDLDKVSGLRGQYIAYFNKQERLWVDFKSKKVQEDDAKNQFFELRKEGEQIEALDNKLHINGKIKTLKLEADVETNNYFKQYHNSNNNE